MLIPLAIPHGMEERKGKRYLDGNALLGVRHQEEEDYQYKLGHNTI